MRSYPSFTNQRSTFILAERTVEGRVTSHDGLTYVAFDEAIDARLALGLLAEVIPSVYQHTPQERVARQGKRWIFTVGPFVVCAVPLIDQSGNAIAIVAWDERADDNAEPLFLPLSSTASARAH